MRKPLVVLCMIAIFLSIAILPGCTATNTPVSQDDPKPVEPVGQVPDSLKTVVENNLFYGITAFDDRLLKAETSYEDTANKIVNHKVQMMDLYGNTLAQYECTSHDAYHVSTMTATDDGGFLFVLGFEEYVDARDGRWASENGFASRVIKCDETGAVQFDTALDSIEGGALRFCFEKYGRYYFFGNRETPETDKIGVYSYTDIYMTVLDEHGAVLKTQCIAGSDFDNLQSAELLGEEFRLSIRSQSDDGDFEGSNSGGRGKDWVIWVNGHLEITNKTMETGRDYFDDRLGERAGAPIYKSDTLLHGFDGGRPTAFIDYGDFYLIISENNTGIYENKPSSVNATWYYTETVYSAYDYEGNLLFRAAVDSSKDFDALVAKYEILTEYGIPIL